MLVTKIQINFQNSAFWCVESSFGGQILGGICRWPPQAGTYYTKHQWKSESFGDFSRYRCLYWIEICIFTFIGFSIFRWWHCECFTWIFIIIYRGHFISNPPPSIIRINYKRNLGFPPTLLFPPQLQLSREEYTNLTHNFDG